MTWVGKVPPPIFQKLYYSRVQTSLVIKIQLKYFDHRYVISATATCTSMFWMRSRHEYILNKIWYFGPIYRMVIHVFREKKSQSDSIKVGLLLELQLLNKFWNWGKYPKTWFCLHCCSELSVQNVLNFLKTGISGTSWETSPIYVTHQIKSDQLFVGKGHLHNDNERTWSWVKIKKIKIFLLPWKLWKVQILCRIFTK